MTSMIPLRFLITLFLLMTFFQALDAQDNKYLKGYMITSGADTITGYIRDDRRIKLSQEFYFKKDLNKTQKVYDTEQAIGFFIEPASSFKKMKIEVDGQMKDRFVSHLLSGHTNVFKYNGEKGNEFLFIKPSGERLQISRRDSIGRNEYFEDSQYFGELKYFFRDCLDIAANTNSIKYEDESIVRLVERYNKCVSPDDKSKRIQAKRKIRFGIEPIVRLQNYNIETSARQPPSTITEDQNLGAQFGGILSIYFFKSISFRTGIIYGSYTSRDESSFSLCDRDILHHFSIIELPLEVKCNITNNRVSPYIIGGVRIGKSLDSSVNVNTTQFSTGTVLSDEDFQLLFEKVFGISAGGGLTTKISDNIDLNFEATYNFLELFYRTRNDVTIKGPSVKLGLHVNLLN